MLVSRVLQSIAHQKTLELTIYHYYKIYQIQISNRSGERMLN